MTLFFLIFAWWFLGVPIFWLARWADNYSWYGKDFCRNITAATLFWMFLLAWIWPAVLGYTIIMWIQIFFEDGISYLEEIVIWRCKKDEN